MIKKGYYAMKKLLKRIASGILSFALGITAIASSFSITASAATDYVNIQDNYKMVGNGHNEIWYLRLGVLSGYYQYSELFDVFCIENNAKAYRDGGYKQVSNTNSKLTRGQQALVAEICYYGYNQHKNKNNLVLPITAHSEAANWYVATQALIWEVTNGARNTTTFALTGASKKYLCTSYGTGATTAYEYIASNVLKYRSTPTSNSGTHTLKWNAANNRYEVIIPANTVYSGAANESTDFAAKVQAAGLGCVGSGPNYIVYTSSHFTGTKTVNYNRKLPPTGKYYYEYQKSASQAVCRAGDADPIGSVVRFNAEAAAELKVTKRTSTNGTTDASVKSAVVNAARFRLYDVSVGKYIIVDGSANAGYSYSSSTGTESTGSYLSLSTASGTYGTFSVKGLPPTTKVKVVETTTAAGYTIPDKYKSIANADTIALGNSTTNLTITNNREVASLKVTKTTSVNGTADSAIKDSVLLAARFHLYDVTAGKYVIATGTANTGYIYSHSTGDDSTASIFALSTAQDSTFGTFTISELPKGRQYKLIETTTAAHYEIPSTNKDLASADVITLDANTDIALNNNRTLRLYVSKRKIADSKELSGAKMEIVDKATGNTVFNWTSDGTDHIITGINAGSYTLKETAAPNGYIVATNIDFTIDNDNKVTATGTTIESKNDIPLIVMLDAMTLVTISKQDITNSKEIEGAHLIVKDDKGKTVDEWTSVKDKSHHIRGLVVGKKYTLIEDLAPLGYRKASNIQFTVEGKLTASGQAKEQSVVMKDEWQVGNLYVRKSTTENKNIENIEFGLKGTSTLGKKINLKTKTDETGIAKFENVPVGTYTLTENGETVSEAYTIAPQQTVTIEDAITTNVTVENLEKTGDVKVQKHTEGDLNISGIKLILAGTSDSGREISIESITDENGVAEFKSVPIGTYTISEDESSVPTAYMIADEQEVTVVYTETVDATFFNQEKTGSIKVHKHTEGDLNIKGIKFILEGTSDSGREIKAEAVTDEKGEALFEKLPIGTYTISEDEETVPTAYLVCDKQEVKVEYAKTTDAEYLNAEKSGVLQIQKRTEGMTDISGIKFIIEGKSDTGRDIKVEVVTDKDGKAKIEVPCGIYTVTEDEKSVPEGYVVADKQDGIKIEFAKTVDVTFTNSRIPKTGYTESNPMVVVLILGVAAIATGALYGKKKEN